MRARARLVLFLVVFVAVVWFVLDRVRIFVTVPATLPGLLGFIVVVALILFLLLDHLINRTR